MRFNPATEDPSRPHTVEALAFYPNRGPMRPVDESLDTEADSVGMTNDYNFPEDRSFNPDASWFRSIRDRRAIKQDK